MIKEREPALERISVTFQVFLTLACFYFTLWVTGVLTQTNLTGNMEHLVIAFIMAPIWFGLLEFFEMGVMARIQRYRQLIKNYIVIISLGSFALFFLVETLNYQLISSKIIIVFATINFFVLTFQKLTGRMIMKYFRRKGYNSRMIFIIADDSSIPFINQIIEMDDWGYIIRGIFTNSEKVKDVFGNRFSIYPDDKDFSKIIDEKVVDEVFFCKKEFHIDAIRKMVDECSEVGVNFHIHNKVLTFGGLKPNLSFFNHQFFLSFRNTPENYFALKLKSIIDFFFTVFILIMISPIMLIIGILIKLEDGGPVLFKQIRVGKHGRLFKCLKFRTMVVDAEAQREKLIKLNEQDGPVFKIKADPRITKVGKFLRKTSLDELPQFVNVLMGDMSIVGPRPPIPSEVKQYKRSLNRRLSINPGITCIWQVSGRNNVPFEQWMEMDMEYIDNWSLKLDFIIILKTFKIIFTGNGQ